MEDENKYKFACIILAAGKGTRMRSSLPKVMHKLAGKPMIAHAVGVLGPLSPEKIAVVIAPGMDAVRDAGLAEDPMCSFAVQERQRGTAHAVSCAKEMLEGYSDTILILYGDTPLLTAATLRRVLEVAQSVEVVVLGMRLEDPTGYGRMVVDANGQLEEIVECRDASADHKQITLCNSGVMAVRGKHVFDLLQKIETNNSQGEYYLTDIVALADAQGLHCRVVEAPCSELAGVNSRAQLAEAEAIIQARLRARAMEEGVTLVDPSSVTFSMDTRLGPDVVVHPHVVFGARVRVEDGVEIRSFSHIEGADIGQDAVIGPFARLRPGSVIGRGAHVGNFVELKQAMLGEGAKANHLSYIGDASVGANANIGAGTITCNYDGVNKHKTTIGKGAFIGSNTSLVAPVTIGENAMTGAGSVITENVEAGALALARGRQVNKQRNAKPK